jgi:transposase
METITLNKRQQRRVEVLGRLASGAIRKVDAQNLLGLGRRQVDRLVKEYRRKGLASVIHGNAGRTPRNKTPDYVTDRLALLAGEGGMYHGLNVCHLSDILCESEEFRVGRSTLDRILRERGLIRAGKHKPKERRKRRERSPREGMLLQIDGSFHDWLCARGPKMTLIGAVDDATGKIIYAGFRPTEDQAGYLMMLRAIAMSHGLPECFYHDRHTILRSPATRTIEDELTDRVPRSQVQRVMSELGIASIPAHSPQAKGRIERLWKTLQDRLIKEMSIEGIADMAEANAFLPGFIERFNVRFGKTALESESAWVEIEADMDMHYHFSTSEQRTVRRDHTISFMGKTLSVLPDERHPFLSGKRVDVRTSPEGEIRVYTGKEMLLSKEIELREVTPSQEKKKVETKPHDPKAKRRPKGWLFQRTAA